VISIEGLTVEFGGFTLLNDISFVVNKKDRIALVGKNGAGKSTMLKIFAGKQAPTSGQVISPKDITIGYLPQHMQLVDGNTVVEEASLAFSRIQQLEKELDSVNLQLAERTDYESDAYSDLIERSTTLNEEFMMSGAGNFQAEVEKTLMGLGFKRNDFERPTKEFSGGWRMRIELAKLLLQRPDVLLLDEPTNHLDIESIQWLENFLATKAKTVILVSHDRAFLDAVTQRTIEITLGRVYDYRVHYSKYVELRKERREQQIRAYENQQKQIQQTEDFIERFRYKATKSVQVQSRIKQLDKLERLEVDEEDNSSLRLKFPPAPRSGSYPIIAEGLKKTYGSQTVFSDVEMTIKRGEKVAFVGKNGEGKSTFVKCIMGEIPFDGKLELGHNIKIGYFAQNQAQLLDENKTVFDTIDYVATGDIRTRIRDILGGFMFGGEASDKKVKVLSGGERSRLAMIRLLLEPVNLLILDEPTNHLDMRSKDVLKDAIRDFDGTVIVVSHDREFLDGLVEKTYEFADGKVKEHLGGIYEFLRSKQMDNLRELDSQKKVPTYSEQLKAEPDTISNLSYEERKEQARVLKKMEKQVSEKENQIEQLEKDIAQLEKILSQPEHASEVSLFQKHGELNKQLEQTMESWEELSSEYEKMKSRAGAN
jgi:ATP-binding cassette, subfamily F, member 3